MTRVPFRLLLLPVVLVSLVATAAAKDRRGPFVEPPRSVRSRDVDQQHVRLELAFDFDAQRIDVQEQLTLEPFRTLTEVTLDAVDLKFSRIALAGAPQQQASLRYRTQRGEVVIQLPRAYQAGEKLTLELAYHVLRPQHGPHFVVPDDSEPLRAPMIWTQNEPELARHWIACIDSPTDRLTSEIITTLPERFEVLSNGTLREQRKHADGTFTWHWSQTRSHVPYLISIVAGEFKKIEQQWDGIPVVSYVPPNRLADAPRSFDKTADMVKYFSAQIGYRYPWPKYAQICVDEYMWGGMEHTSATTLTLRTLHDERAHSDVSSDNLVAHELAHQWWGDLLTCKDWGELWLNESFATYFATLWMEHDLGWDEAAWARYNEAESYRKEDRDRYRRPLVTYRYRRPSDMFDRHSYPKGARVLHMLRHELGDELFWRGIRQYCVTNAFRTVETADLRIAMEQATGRGLTRFFDQWVYHGGHPKLNVSYQWNAEQRMVRLSIKQTQEVDELTPLYHLPVEVALVAEDGSVQIRRLTLTKADETIQLDSPQRPRRVVFDPQDWLLKELVFVKDKEEWIDQLAYDKHVIARIRAIESLTEFRDDEGVSMALMRAAIEDPFWGVRQQAAEALGKFRGEQVQALLLGVAHADESSKVRRAAIGALKKFSDNVTREGLRLVVKHDPSYYAVAEALKTLVEIDPAGAESICLASLSTPSHQEQILTAACDGLVKLKSKSAAEQIARQLKQQPDPERRVILIAALARLNPDDASARQTLIAQLDNRRSQVRRKAIAAMEELGDSAALAALLAHRDQEETHGMLQAIDDAVEKIRGRNAELDKLQDKVDALEQRNRSIEQRLKELAPKKAAVSADKAK